jgi:hypothetical protein
MNKSRPRLSLSLFRDKFIINLFLGPLPRQSLLSLDWKEISLILLGGGDKREFLGKPWM